jgi:hypothetical protein
MFYKLDDTWAYKFEFCKSTYNLVVNELKSLTSPILYTVSFCGNLTNN